jgi:hypothetical protein
LSRRKCACGWASLRSGFGGFNPRAVRRALDGARYERAFNRNTGVIISEFVGIAQASELFGISRYLTVPVTAFLIWWLVVHGTQKRVEQVFLVMSLVFFCYIAAAFLANPDWGEVAAETIKPSFQFDMPYLFTVWRLSARRLRRLCRFTFSLRWSKKD